MGSSLHGRLILALSLATVAMTAAAFCAAPQDAPPVPPPSAPQDPPPPSPPSQDPQLHQLWKKGQVERGEFVTLFFGAGHDHGKIMKPILDKYIDPAQGEWVEAQEALHVLAINVKKDKVAMIEQVIAQLDMPPPQVELQCHVAEISWSRDFEIGFMGGLGDFIIWRAFDPDAVLQTVAANFRPASAVAGSPFQGSTFAFSAWPGGKKGRGTFGALVESFVERGQARILSQPRLVVNSGAAAEFYSFEEMPIPLVTIQGLTVFQNITYKQVGTSVKLETHVVGSNQVDIEITLHLSAVSDIVSFPVGASTVPVPLVTTRVTKSNVTVNDDQEIVISGLVRRVETESRRGFPLISEIPIIGYLFSSTDTEERIQELVFIVRPKIIHQDPNQMRRPQPLIDPFPERNGDKSDD